MMTEVPPLVSPYKGLRPFSEEDAPFFFGRESETRITCANLRTRRLTLLYGPSGVGKSSLLRAGVVHNLQQLNSQLKIRNIEATEHDSAVKGFDLMKEPFLRSRRGTGPSQYQCPVIVVVFDSWIGDALISLQDAILAALSKSVPDIFTLEKNEGLRALAGC